MRKEMNLSNEQETLIKSDGTELQSWYCQSGERRVVQAGTVGNINHRVDDWSTVAVRVT
jgi:hypothetical protein